MYCNRILAGTFFSVCILLLSGHCQEPSKSFVTFGENDGVNANSSNSKGHALSIERKNTQEPNKMEIFENAFKTQLSNKASPSEMDKFINALIDKQIKDQIQNTFDSISLDAIELRSRLDKRIDETLMKLQGLKNLRRQIEASHNFTDLFVKSNIVDRNIKRYAISVLNQEVDEVKQSLDDDKNK